MLFLSKMKWLPSRICVSGRR